MKQNDKEREDTSLAAVCGRLRFGASLDGRALLVPYKQHKVRKEKTRQDETRPNKTKQDKRRQDKTGQDKKDKQR